MIKEYDFHCPFCNKHLNKGDAIILKTVRENGDKGEIHLSTTVGNYKYKHVPNIRFDPGELVDFLCTDCNESLNSTEYDKYALLKLRVDETIEFDVLFSRQAGVQKTYLITEDGIESYIGNP